MEPKKKKILVEVMAFLSLTAIIKCALYRRTYDGAEHLGSFVMIPVVSATILILTK